MNIIVEQFSCGVIGRGLLDFIVAGSFLELLKCEVKSMLEITVNSAGFSGGLVRLTGPQGFLCAVSTNKVFKKFFITRACSVFSVFSCSTATG